MSAAAGNELIIVRMLDAPRAKVWRACKEPAALRQWWGLPTGATMHICTVDFRVGGAMHCEIEHGTMTLWFKWNYREIAEGERLVLEQHISDAAGRELDTSDRPASTVTLCLEDANGKTRMTITHTGMASEKYRAEDYKAGWSESLHRLLEHLTKGAA